MKFVIYGELTDLNTYINAERSNKFGAATIKRNETMRVRVECMRQKVKPVRHMSLAITWYCKNQKKDPDNIAFAKKFILDGMREAGVIQNDGWEQIDGFVDIFAVDKVNPRVEVDWV